MTTDVMECPHCSEQVASDSNSCPACGHLHASEPCALHPGTSALGVCVMCGTPVCEECNKSTGTAFICSDHAEIPVMDGWAQVYTSSDDVEADLIRENLQAEGIDAQVLSQKDHFSFTVDLGDLSPVRVLVPAFSYLDASRVLESHRHRDGSVNFACPSCGEAFDGDAEICASCGASVRAI